MLKRPSSVSIRGLDAVRLARRYLRRLSRTYCVRLLTSIMIVLCSARPAARPTTMRAKTLCSRALGPFMDGSRAARALGLCSGIWSVAAIYSASICRKMAARPDESPVVALGLDQWRAPEALRFEWGIPAACPSAGHHLIVLLAITPDADLRPHDLHAARVASYSVPFLSKAQTLLAMRFARAMAVPGGPSRQKVPQPVTSARSPASGSPPMT